MMASGPGYSSSSEADRMIIDLEYRSEGDTGNEGSATTANETDVDSLCSPTKRADSRSEPPGENVTTSLIDDVDMLDIFRRTERSETDENMSANGDNDYIDENVEESGACDVREIDNEDDSDDDNKLVIREEEEEQGKAEKAMEDEKIDEKEADVSQIDEKETDDSEIDTDLSQRMNLFLESSQNEMSETFLDNLNPQDDSQALDEEQEEMAEKDNEQGAKEKTVDEDIGDSEEGDVSQRLSSLEYSGNFEMSETFLDNLNPQDDSQYLDEEQGERDSDHIVEDISRDDASQKDDPDNQASLPYLEYVEDEASFPHKQNTSLHGSNMCEEASPSHINIDMTTSDLAQGHSITDIDSTPLTQQTTHTVEASSPSPQDTKAVEASSHVHKTTESEVTSPHEQNASAIETSSSHVHETTEGEASFPHKQETSADEAAASPVCQDVTTEEASSSTVQKDIAAEEASSPHTQETAVNKSLSHHDDQDATAGETCASIVKGDITLHMVASPCPVEQDVTADEASSPCSMKQDVAADEASSPAEEVASSSRKVMEQDFTQDEAASSVKQVSATDEVSGSCVEKESKLPQKKMDEVSCHQDGEHDALSCQEEKDTAIMEEEGDNFEERKEAPPVVEEKDKESLTKEDEDAREEGEYTSSPSSSSEPDDGQGGDVLHLSVDDLEVRDGYLDNKRKCEKDENSSGDEGERCVNRSTSSPAKSDVHRISDDNSSAPLLEDVISEDEEDCRRSKNERQKENSNVTGDEDGIDIIETSVDLDDKDDTGSAPVESSSKGSPALGVTRVIQRGNGDDDDSAANPVMVPAAEVDSDDDVQIIECPPQEPIDTLIVDDDDEEEDVPSSAVTSKTSVGETSRTSSKKKRTVEHDGHDLRIVIREERQEKDDSDRRRRRHDRERREERRSDSHRRSESDRKSSDRSSRRRHHRSRSHSRERRRRRSRSRSRSRDRTSRRRRHRDRSRDKSAEREKSSHRKRRRDRSRERRHRSRSKSRSPKQSREGSWDKENRDEGEVTEHSRSKRRRYCRHEDKHRESPEERSTTKVEDSPVRQRSSQRQSRTWSPSDTFLKDPTDTPSSVQSPVEKSDDESEEGEASVEEVEQPAIVADTSKEGKPSQSEKEPEVIAVDAPLPDPKDIPILKPEDIPFPELKAIPVPEPPAIPIPHPVLISQPEPMPPALPEPELVVEPPPLPPVPEEEPMENPPEPPPLPIWREGAPPPKGEGLLPTPIRRKAALEEAAAAVYDPAHPTDDEAERFIFQGVPNAGHPHPEMMGGLPHHPGQLMSDGTFVVPAPGEGSLLGPPPQRVPMQQMAFRTHRPMLMNPVVLNRPPFNNGPFPPTQLPGPPLPARFRLPMGAPGSVIPLQNQFGQGLPPDAQGLPPDGQGLPPESQGLPPQGFPGQMNDRFEDGPPPPPLGQFPVSIHSGLPEMPNMAAPPGPLPSDIRMLPHLPPPPPDMSSIQDNCQTDDKFDRTLANLVVAQNLLTVIKDHKPDGEPGSLLPPTSVFKIPPPPLPAKLPNHFLHQTTEPPSMMDQSEDSTEVMDMDMSPLDEDCELQLPTPPDGTDSEREDKGKNSRPLAAIDLRAISNAIKKLTSLPTDEMPASAVELTNKEKYMKKLHLQERVVDEVKQALRPFYSHKKITKEEYKTILRKAVPKVCHSRSGDVNPQKILQLVEGYVNKFQKQRQYSDQKVNPPKTSAKERGKANGERAKPPR